jgi:hypothetical protein
LHCKNGGEYDALGVKVPMGEQAEGRRLEYTPLYNPEYFHVFPWLLILFVRATTPSF